MAATTDDGPFSVVVGRRRGHARVVRVAGEVDLATANLVADALRLASGPGVDVVVDLTDVRFADTSLGHALVTARARQVNVNGSLTIVNVPSVVWRLLCASRFAEELGVGTSSAGPGFDRAGFDRAGFDRAGFDRAGARCSAHAAVLPASSPRFTSAR
jgi:anti-anti-sigma factor